MPHLPITSIAEIYHLTRNGDTESYPVNPDISNVNVCVSPTGTDIQSSYGDVQSYQLFEIFIYDITLTIFNGDKIITQDNQAYIVAGAPFVVNNQYLQYIRVLTRQVI